MGWVAGDGQGLKDPSGQSQRELSPPATPAGVGTYRHPDEAGRVAVPAEDRGVLYTRGLECGGGGGFSRGKNSLNSNRTPPLDKVARLGNSLRN